MTQPPPETYLKHQAANDDIALSPKQFYIVTTVGANSVFVPRGRVTEYKVYILEVIDPRTPTDLM